MADRFVLWTSQKSATPLDDLIRNVVAVSSMGLERYAEAAGYFERFLAEEPAAAITPMR